MIKDSNKALADFENAPEQTVALDRMRYTKNKLSGNLALLAIVCNVLYFVAVYKTDVGNYFYEFFIGASVLYNLVFMLTAFLSSESVKNYKISYNVPKRWNFCTACELMEERKWLLLKTF